MGTKKIKLLFIEVCNDGVSNEYAYLAKGMADLVYMIDRASTLEEAETTYDLNSYHMFLLACGENAQELLPGLRGKGITAPLFFLLGQPYLPFEIAAMADEKTMFFPAAGITPELFNLMIRYALLYHEHGEQKQPAVRITPAPVCTGQQNMETSLFSDALTGLNNRAFFLDNLAQLNTAEHRPISLIMGDMDGLTLINDAFGYGEGDRLLREVSKALQACCRNEDIIARWSGDAFAVLLPRRSHQDAMTVITCVKAALAAAAADPVGPSVSFGCATQEDSSQDIHDVLQTAEMEMHRKKISQGKEFCDTIIASLVHALGKKDYETEEHTWRMQNLAFKLGGVFGLSDSQFEDLVLAVTLHDVGKIAVPEHILMKPGSLTNEEWETIKGHSERGYRIALCSSELAHSAPYILSHHERWDGKGYPQGLKQEEIPLISRIISVIDSYDVMVNGRPYKRGMAQQAAMDELKRCAGSQFDPRLVEMFITVLMTQDNEIYLKGV